MATLLVVYCSYDYPLRTTVRDHLYAFARYGGHRCFFLNLAVRRPSRVLLSIPFDVVVYHTTFLSLRAWAPATFWRLAEKARPLSRLSGVKAALPQDEFLNTDDLCEFINRFRIDVVFSVMPAEEWAKIYWRVDRIRTRFIRVLTGYLDEGTLSRIARLARACPKREIDIGYRAWRGAAWLGRHGTLKAKVAQVVQERAPIHGLRTDISVCDEDAIMGDGWYQFLLRCKCTIGVEGGASILDATGSIKAKTEAYLQAHPKATFEELEASCFPGVDGMARLVAISPRHLEACATRTCQILIEGDYNNILKPGLHYLPLKADFSNIDEVLVRMQDDALRSEMTERAYRDIVQSNAYTYRRFVDYIVVGALGEKPGRCVPWWAGIVWRWAEWNDQLSWLSVLARKWCYRAAATLPAPCRDVLRRVRNTLRPTE